MGLMNIAIRSLTGDETLTSCLAILIFSQLDYPTLRTNLKPVSHVNRQYKFHTHAQLDCAAYTFLDENVLSDSAVLFDTFIIARSSVNCQMANSVTGRAQEGQATRLPLHQKLDFLISANTKQVEEMAKLRADNDNLQRELESMKENIVGLKSQVTAAPSV